MYFPATPGCGAIFCRNAEKTPLLSVYYSVDCTINYKNLLTKTGFNGIIYATGPDCVSGLKKVKERHMKKLTSILLSVIMVASLFAGVITINAEDEALDTPEKIVTALYALDKGATLAGGPYTLSGKVTSVVEKYTTEYNNVSVMMSLPGLADYPVEAFRIVGEGIDKIDVGYTITVTGELTHYYNKNKDESIFEFKKNSTLDYYTPIKNVSYDRLSYDGVLVVPEGSVDKKVVDPANADAINFNKGSVTTATISGATSRSW